MQPSSRELLTLIQDCANAEEAQLLLRACGIRLDVWGGFWDRCGFRFEAGDIVYCCGNETLRCVCYGQIRALLERQDG